MPSTIKTDKKMTFGPLLDEILCQILFLFAVIFPYTLSLGKNELKCNQNRENFVPTNKTDKKTAKQLLFLRCYILHKRK